MTLRIVQEQQAGEVAAELRLPETVQLSLLDLQGAVREGLMAMRELGSRDGEVHQRSYGQG